MFPGVFAVFQPGQQRGFQGHEQWQCDEAPQDSTRSSMRLSQELGWSGSNQVPGARERFMAVVMAITARGTSSADHSARVRRSLKASMRVARIRLVMT